MMVPVVPPMSGESIHNYLLNGNELQDVIRKLSDPSLIEGFKSFFANPLDAVLSVRAYPFEVTTDSQARLRRLNASNVTYDKAVDPLYYDTHKTLYRKYIVGNHLIPEFYGDFRDYDSRYTKYQLFLPYVGFVDLDPSVWTGKYLSIHYMIDYSSGGCTVYLLRKDTDEDDAVVVSQHDGIIAAELPVNALNMGEITRSIAKMSANLLISVGMSAATGSPLPMLGTQVAGDIQQLAFSGGPPVAKGGSPRNNLTLTNPTRVNLITTRANTYAPDGLASQKGLPYMQAGQIKAIEGYGVIDSIHIPSITGATSEEITEIESLLKTGVHVHV